MASEHNLEALTQIISLLQDMEDDAKKRTLQSVATFLGISLNSIDQPLNSRVYESSSLKNDLSFSENRTISPKEFLRDKAPKTDIERITCLAYYLTHYRDTPHFKTVDLSTLNTEAAQPKLSNPTVAVDNATRGGYLVQAMKGSKQISIIGETFVQTLPDRESAKAAIAGMRTKTKRRIKKPTIKNRTIKSEESE